MKSCTFQERMKFLIRKGYPILSLKDGVEQFSRKLLPACATIITIDDGFYSTWKLAVPILKKLKIPATIYATTYYSRNNNPIFRLVVQYMIWKTKVEKVDLSALGLEGVIDVDDITQKTLVWQIIDYGESRLDEESRVQLCVNLGRQLGIDYFEIANERFFALMTEEEIHLASEIGMDIQLHSHRHNPPFQPKTLQKEIDDNRNVLEPLVMHPLFHYCYPSGIYDKQHLPYLEAIKIYSATTCDAGLNYPDQHPLMLLRFLDGDDISWIEFEAEMSGFADLLRKLRLHLGNFLCKLKKVVLFD